MTTLSSKSGSIYDTLYVSKMKKNTLVNGARPQAVAFNVYDASQKKSGPTGTDRLAYMPQPFDKVNGHKN